jgi:glycosyltransferase involved in cell wall biosynthesis
MRILHFITDLTGGGAEKQLSYLAPELVRMGHEVHVAYYHDGPSKQQLPGVELHQFRASSNYDPALLWQAFSFVRCLKPDIIQTWLLQMDVLGAVVACLNGIPLVFREPSSALAYTMNLKNRLRIYAASQAGAIICNSHGGAAYWEKLLPGCRPQIVANGLPIDEIDSARAPLPPAVDQPGVPIVMYAGRIIPDKNIVALVEAFSRVVQELPALLVICGEGPQQPELDCLVREKGLVGRVIFTGFLPTSSVWTLMKKAELFVSLSQYEGCPNTVMEAMANGCPVFLSDIPAHREIADERCAVLVNPDHLDHMAKLLLKALNERDESLARAVTAKKKTQEWSIKMMASKYERIYKGLL